MFTIRIFVGYKDYREHHFEKMHIFSTQINLDLLKNSSTVCVAFGLSISIAHDQVCRDEPLTPPPSMRLCEATIE